MPMNSLFYAGALTTADLYQLYIWCIEIFSSASSARFFFYIQLPSHIWSNSLLKMWAGHVLLHITVYLPCNSRFLSVIYVPMLAGWISVFNCQPPLTLSCPWFFWAHLNFKLWRKWTLNVSAYELDGIRANSSELRTLADREVEPFKRKVCDESG